MEKRNKIIAIIIVVGLVVFGAVMAIINSRATDKVVISELKKNLPENAPEYLVDSIEGGAYYQLGFDLGDDLNTSSINGVIRDGSATIFADWGNTQAGKFIVDMDSIKYSYLVYYSYGENSRIASGVMGEYQGVLIFCLSNPDDIIYPESACGNSKATNQDELYLNLPDYQYALGDGREVTLSFSPGKEVMATVNHCGVTIDNAPIIAKAKEWVEGYGMEPSDFTYKVPLSYNDCLMK